VWARSGDGEAASVDDDDLGEKEAGGGEALVVGNGEGGVDATCGEAEEGALLGRVLVGDEVCGGEEPESAVDATGRGERLVDVSLEQVEGLGVLLLDGVPLVLEVGEREVSRGEALAEQGLSDVPALCLLGEVLDDAPEVARVDALGQGAGLVLTLEEGDPVDDRLQRPCGDDAAEVPLGVVESESGEGCVEEGAADGILPTLPGLSCLVLLALALQQRGAGLGDLLGGRLGVSVELGAGLAVAVSAGAVVDGAGPGRDDEAGDLGSEVLGVAAVTARGGASWAKRPKAPSTCGLSVGTKGRLRMRSVSPRAASTSSPWLLGLLSSSRAMGGAPVVRTPSAKASATAAASSVGRIEAPVKAPESVSTRSSRLTVKGSPLRVTTSSAPSPTHWTPGWKVRKPPRLAAASGGRPRFLGMRTPWAWRMSLMCWRPKGTRRWNQTCSQKAWKPRFLSAQCSHASSTAWRRPRRGGRRGSRGPGAAVG